MRVKAQRVARPVQTRMQNSGVTGPKFTKFLIIRRRVIGGVNARIRLANVPTVVQYEGRACRFSPIRDKNQLGIP